MVSDHQVGVIPGDFKTGQQQVKLCVAVVVQVTYDNGIVRADDWIFT